MNGGFKIGGVEVTHLTHDSRSVQTGSCFFAIKGQKTSGKMYIMQAVTNGAAIIVAQHSEDLPTVSVPILFVDNVREYMAYMAKQFNNNIADKMNIIGITGTNGKTTCSYILQHLLSGTAFCRKRKVGIIGTLGAFVSDKCIEKGLTTPDPIQLHHIFSKMYKMGVRTVIMEVSAHAIHYHKIAGINLKIGIFTNLTQDHLDFFPSMAEYANTKVKYMTSKSVRMAISNADDEYGRIIISTHPKATGYSINDASYLLISQGGSQFVIGRNRIRMNLAGRFNVSNALACIKAARELRISWCKIKRRLATIEQIPGRFNVFTHPRGFSIVIDYAHTPDSIEKILSASRDLIQNLIGKLIVVFGCGGNRDRDKREIMGKTAGQLADFVVVTSDNPRDESPMAIMLQIEAGLKTTGVNYSLIENRMDATNTALDMANICDVVVIAGKGAEITQEIAGIYYPYSDTEIVEEYISKGN